MLYVLVVFIQIFVTSCICVIFLLNFLTIAE